MINKTQNCYGEQICEGATFKDLDTNAIKIMKEKYAKKQDNPSFVSLDDRQALSDLKLINGDRVTNAAVLLVGKESFINKRFPQAKVMLEYRNTESQIHFDSRLQFSQPFFILIDMLWEAVNLRNGSVPIREGSYIFGIPLFNEDVIREVANNAFAHRNYRINSEIVIKPFLQKYGKAKRADLDKVVGNHISEKQMRRYLDELRVKGLIETGGKRNYRGLLIILGLLVFGLLGCRSPVRAIPSTRCKDMCFDSI